MSLLFAVPLAGERLDGTTLAFALAVIATVYAGKKMPIHTAGKTGMNPHVADTAAPHQPTTPGAAMPARGAGFRFFPMTL